jgi:hypothetical protein
MVSVSWLLSTTKKIRRRPRGAVAADDVACNEEVVFAIGIEGPPPPSSAVLAWTGLAPNPMALLMIRLLNMS